MPFPRIRSNLALAALALATSVASAADGALSSPPSPVPQFQPISLQGATPAPAAAPPEGFYLVEDAPVILESSYRARGTDKSFRDLVSRWGADTGWQVAWELDADYSFSYASDFGPDLLRAVDGVCGSLNSLGVRARALAYPDNKVLRIVLEGTAR